GTIDALQDAELLLCRGRLTCCDARVDASRESRRDGREEFVERRSADGHVIGAAHAHPIDRPPLAAELPGKDAADGGVVGVARRTLNRERVEERLVRQNRDTKLAEDLLQAILT